MTNQTQNETDAQRRKQNRTDRQTVGHRTRQTLSAGNKTGQADRLRTPNEIDSETGRHLT